MNKTTRIHLRVTEEEKARWDAEAKALGLPSLAELVRSRLNGSTHAVPRPHKAAPVDPLPEPAQKPPRGLVLNCRRCRTIGQPSCPECRAANNMA